MRKSFSKTIPWSLKWYIYCINVATINTIIISDAIKYLFRPFNTACATFNNTTAFSIAVPISMLLTVPGPNRVIDIGPHLTQFDWLLRQGQHVILICDLLDVQLFRKLWRFLVYLHSNFKEGIFRCSIITSVFCITKNLSIVSSFRMMYFVPASSNSNYWTSVNNKVKQSSDGNFRNLKNLIHT